MLNPQLPLVDADGDASLSFSFRTDALTMAGEYTVCAEYVETRDHLTRARSDPTSSYMVGFTAIAQGELADGCIERLPA